MHTVGVRAVRLCPGRAFHTVGVRAVRIRDLLRGRASVSRATYAGGHGMRVEGAGK